MKLELKNIKQHKSFCIELPDSGIVLLRGKSGSGKSSIFSAIADALYDNGVDMTNWDESKSSICLEYLGFTVVKNRGPNNLTLTDKDGKVYRDEEAQGEICRILGMREDEFSASSYVVQEAKNSLLSLPAAEQLRFIQRLAFGDQDPEVFKIRIKNQMDRRSEAVRTNEKILAARIEFLASKKSKYETLLASIGPEPIAVDSQRKSFIEEEIKKTNAAIEKTKNEIKTLEKSLNDPVYDQIEVAERRISDTELLIAANTEKSTQLHEKFLVVSSGFNLEESSKIQEQISDLNNLKLFNSWAEKAKLLKEEIVAKFPETKNAKTVAEGLLELSRSFGDQASKTFGAITSKKNDLKLLTEAKKCPQCGVNLSISSGEIILHSHQGEDLSENIKQELRELETALVASRAAFYEVNETIGKLDSLKASQPASPRVKSENPDAEISELKIKLKDLETKEKEISLIERSLDSLSKDNKAFQESIERTQQIIQNASLLPKRSDLSKKKDDLLKAQFSCMEYLDKLHAELNEINKNIQKMLEYNGVLNLVKAAEREYLEAQSLKDEVERQFELSKTDLANSISLKEVSDRAALEAVEEIINSINVNAKYYIDQMFQSEGTVVAIQNKKTTLSGEDRAKISLKIFHKGSDVKHFKSMSGGERSRITLDFQLAMSDLYQSPILMLDEAFTGLDHENKIICLETLKQVGTRKLVLVIEHGAPEHIFDNIIDL